MELADDGRHQRRRLGTRGGGGRRGAGGVDVRPFLRSWLPFGDDTGGDLLFVDLRSGDQSGCVAGFEHDNGGFKRPAIWPDIAAMLEDVAAALRTGRWVHPNDPEFDQVPVVEDGKLHWEFGPSSQRKLAEAADGGAASRTRLTPAPSTGVPQEPLFLKNAGWANPH